MMRSSMFLIAVMVMTMNVATAFTVPGSSSKTTTSTALSMAPRFDKSSEKWFATKPEEEAGSAYGPFGSLIRAGPKPFFQHLLFPEVYDQAVLKYMAKDGCDRTEAQANMDFYLENPNDWTYYKLQEKKTGKKRDWANVNTDPKQVALSLGWSAVVLVFLGTFISDCLAGKYAT